MMGLGEVGCRCVERIHLTEDGVQWKCNVNMEQKLHDPLNNYSRVEGFVSKSWLDILQPYPVTLSAGILLKHL